MHDLGGTDGLGPVVREKDEPVPADTDGMSEEELAALVTRDSLIGVGSVLHPGGERR